MTGEKNYETWSMANKDYKMPAEDEKFIKDHIDLSTNIIFERNKECKISNNLDKEKINNIIMKFLYNQTNILLKSYQNHKTIIINLVEIVITIS